MNAVFAHDFHVHTHYSVCARDKENARPLRMLQRAQSLGIQTVGFTDHFAQHPPYATPKWKDCGSEIINGLRQEIEDISTPVRVLIGCEADLIDPQTLSMDREYARGLDYVVLSASHFHLPGIQQPESLDVAAVARHYTDALRAALAFDFVSIIAHPFKTPFNALGSMDGYMAKISDETLYEIADKARRARVAMEINAHLGRDQEYLRTIKRFIRICLEVGVRMTYGSDAHHLKDLGPYPGIEQAMKSLELVPEHFLTPDELLSRAW